ncbi:Tetratricopeptide repeat-containing protein [Actinacidiphila yanglinensis]|uniref:Tetratricopeptide repeat-containing protein n=1 Tax=Actinacidiphila yanglinensis TaxID=310779 RepID=A0A1H6ECF3_9ACTN|nr:helix-turn-helix transcriptional regulator [Actinacidiphila yanglinensis]SEG95457.1 Tetratricopeptide repeat-containing protein [Actinacidiphila yanglinensis]
MGTDTFGQLLREARQRALMTLEGLAQASGVSVRAISDLERGRSLPRQGTLGEVLDALELGEDERRRLVQASARPAGRVPQQLPPDSAVFRGREEALAAVHGFAARAAGHVVISAIGGMAGVGKTALAVHWAHQVADRFPDGQLYVNLRGFDDSGPPLEPGEALGGFLTALGVASQDIPGGTEQRSILFREQAASRRLIVVLDNAHSAEQVRPLLPASAGCLTLVTSRNQLSGLAATEAACLISLDVWSPEEALAGLAARIGDDRCAAEPEAAAELVELCGLLPLAVAVVGAQLSATPRMALRAAVRELRESRLDTLSPGDRKVDVRAVFSRSYRALGAETRRFFRCLSLHPGSAVSAEAAASLMAVEMPHARRCLRELVTASLLSRDAYGRYVLHDLVRAYGSELVEECGDDRIGAETRLLDYLRHNAHVHNRFFWDYPSRLPDDPLPGVVRTPADSREEAVDWFRQEEATVAAAVRTLQDPALQRQRMYIALEWTHYNGASGRWAEEIEALRVGLDAALALDDPGAVTDICYWLAVASIVAAGDTAEADEMVELMLTHQPRLPPQDQARTERHVSQVRNYQRRPAEALHHAREALAISRAGHRPDEVAVTLTLVAWLLALLGEYREAITTCEEAIPLLREFGELGNEAGAWDTIGYAQQRLGDLDAAISNYRTSLRICEEKQLGVEWAEVLDHLASALLERGDTEEARTTWHRAADVLTSRRAARAEEMRAKAHAVPRPEADRSEVPA